MAALRDSVDRVDAVVAAADMISTPAKTRLARGKPRLYKEGSAIAETLGSQEGGCFAEEEG